MTTVNDTAAEPTETFSVNLSGATNATIADAQGVGTINDNDTAPLPALSINDVTVTEGGTATFTVSLSAASAQTVTVVASTANATALAPGDYTARTGVTLSFAPGTTTRTFAVTTVNDTAVEPTETFSVNLIGATNATLADATGAGTITDNDVAGTRPNVSINSTSQNRAAFPTKPVPQQTPTTSTGFKVLAVNDLGMHCGDLDTRISSILPPFNVLHAQVVRKGTTGTSKPTLLATDQVTVRYSAAANPNDPVLANTASILDPKLQRRLQDQLLGCRAGMPTTPSIRRVSYRCSTRPRPTSWTWVCRCPISSACTSGMATVAADQQQMPGRFSPMTS